MILNGNLRPALEINGAGLILWHVVEKRESMTCGESEGKRTRRVNAASGDIGVEDEMNAVILAL